MSQQYYFATLDQVMARKQALFTSLPEEEMNLVPRRWIPCSICLTYCFRTRHHSIGPRLTELCKECGKALCIQMIQYLLTKIEKERIRVLKEQLHDELIDFCFRPEYVYKTGELETIDLFHQL